jgi:EAL domain-containing protein (putative c-di-GMP-specific phosphodiesterase class I)
VSRNRLLIMDDDLDVSGFFAEVATGLGFDTQVLNDGKLFFDTVESFEPDLLMLDLQMPNHDGIELLRGLGERACKAKIFIASGLDSRVLGTAEQLGISLGLNIVGTINKPVQFEHLQELLLLHKSNEMKISPDELVYAIETGQLVVHYLPKVTHRGQSRWILEGGEALVRWEHPDYGLLYPTDFLGLAEQTGSIVALTDFVFRSAMQQVRAWFSRGIYVELGLNLSAGFLSDLEFPDRLLKLIREHELDPSMITLELTETSSLIDTDLAMDVLTRLRVKHIKICLDDFGVGNSSLTHLYRMPFSEVKLDNHFINDMRTSTDARQTVEGLIELVHRLKIGVCAEGVEDEATFRMLESMGCDKMQGHYIGQAMPPKAFETLTSSWNEKHRNIDLSQTA